MIITPDVLRALNTAYSKVFQDALKAAPTQYQELATVVPSSTASNTYGWLGSFPKMEEWVSPRVAMNMKTTPMVLLNRKFQATVGVPRTDIEDDNIGLYTPLVAQMGQSAAELPDELVFEAIKKGELNDCYDGQKFFDADHPVFKNVDGTGAATTVSNITAGTDAPWFILDNTNQIRAFLYQNRLSPEFQIQNDPAKSDHVFEEDEYRYGVRARGEAGYGLWQFAHLSKAKLERKAVADAIAQMRSIKGDGGKVLGIRPSILLVPPLLEDAAFEICEAQQINGTTNSMKGRLKVIVSPWLV